MFLENINGNRNLSDAYQQRKEETVLTSKQDRKTLPPSESSNFKSVLSEMLVKVGLDFADAYWLTENRPWNDPADEKSYHVVYESRLLTLDLGIFDSSSYFVKLDIINKENKSSFWLFHFCEVTGCPYFTLRNLRGEEYLTQYLKYLENLLNDPTFVDILTGKFWFDFSFDMRDWATTPGLVTNMRAKYLEARKVWLNSMQS